MKLFHPLHPLLLFILSLHSSRTSATCYFPNGTDVNLFSAIDVYTPCDAGDDVSMCCALNRNVPDKCRSDGLCLSTWDSNIWRDSCTDRTWESPKCIKLCTQGTGQLIYLSLCTMAHLACKGFYIEGTKPLDLSGVHSTITQCTDGSYCCGNGTIGQPCCDQRKGVFLLNGDIVSANPSTATGTATASSATKSSSITSSSFNITSASPPSLPLATSSSPSASPSPDESSSGKMIGIIVGAVLGTALILTMGFAISLLKNSRRKLRQALATDQASTAQIARNAGELYGDDGRKELDGRGHDVELDGRRHEVELGTGQALYHELRG